MCVYCVCVCGGGGVLWIVTMPQLVGKKEIHEVCVRMCAHEGCKEHCLLQFFRKRPIDIDSQSGLCDL